LNDWKAEVIVFPPSSLLRLLDLAVTKEQKVALRTHIEKILNFIRVLALINQKKRLTFEVGDKRFIVVSYEDFYKALEVLQTTIQETITRLGKRQQEVLNLFEEDDTLDKHKVAEKLGVSTDTASKALKSLAKAGYLKENTATKPYTYQLLQKEPNPLGILENPSQYCLFWQESLEKFLKTTIETLQRKGISFQILKPGENEANLVRGLLNDENKKKSQNLGFPFEKTTLSSIQVSEVPSKHNLGLSDEKSQNQLRISEIPRGKGLFLWRRIPPAEKCELCGQLAVEYEVELPQEKVVLRRCAGCFQRLRQTFANTVWKESQACEECSYDRSPMVV
jgi:predicted transcriptional regulator